MSATIATKFGPWAITLSMLLFPLKSSFSNSPPLIVNLQCCLLSQLALMDSQCSKLDSYPFTCAQSMLRDCNCTQPVVSALRIYCTKVLPFTTIHLFGFLCFTGYPIGFEYSQLFFWKIFFFHQRKDHVYYTTYIVNFNQILSFSNCSVLFLIIWFKALLSYKMFDKVSLLTFSFRLLLSIAKMGTRLRGNGGNIVSFCRLAERYGYYKSGWMFTKQRYLSITFFRQPQAA